MRRVVISGLGIVSCLGNNQEEVHQALLNSKSGISYAEEYKEHNLKSHIHGKPKIKLSDFKIDYSNYNDSTWHKTSVPTRYDKLIAKTFDGIILFRKNFEILKSNSCQILFKIIANP